MRREVALPGALTIEALPGQHEWTVSVAGRVVIETSPALRATLLDVIRRRVSPVIVVDVSRVSYLDTSGVATLLEASNLARARAVRLRLVGLTGEPKILAQVTEMDRIFLALGSDVEVH
jgi:anti-sigma B factor antagonist